MARAVAGDQVAFGEVVRHYDDRLRALAWRLLGDRAAMDDVLQDAYVKAYRALCSFREDAAPGTWLHRITYNACIDELRRRQRRPTSAADDLAAAPDPSPTPDDVAVDRSALAVALDALAPDHRAAVLLVDAEGYDYASAGEVLGVPAGTVASRLSRARAALRRALAVDGGGR
jgi:RNA polymerase sigma-70 factor (ECF subfamily)